MEVLVDDMKRDRGSAIEPEWETDCGEYESELWPNRRGRLVEDPMRRFDSAI